MTYYTEVTDNSIPATPIIQCLKCRLLELLEDETPKTHAFIAKNRNQFKAYLESNTGEAAIIDILTKAKVSFQLRKPTYLVREYTGDIFAPDIINGFDAGRYSGESLFAIIDEPEDLHKHSRDGYHIRGEIKFKYDEPEDFGNHAWELYVADDLDLDKYGEDLMTCACTYAGDSPLEFRANLIGEGVGIDGYEGMCRAAATSYVILEDIMDSFAYAGKYFDTIMRNQDIAFNCQHIHPDHREQGLNLFDIVIFLNPEFLNTKSSIMMDLVNNDGDDDEEWLDDLDLLAKSLKYWIDNVRNPEEFDLIINRVEFLENNDFIVDLKRPKVIL